MPFTLTLVSKPEAALALVAAEGEATSADFPAANHVHFDTLLGNHWDTLSVLVDFDRVNYIDSSAVGWLLSTHKSFRLAGGRLVLHSLQPQVRQVLEMLKIDRVITLARDLAAARANVQPSIYFALTP